MSEKEKFPKFFLPKSGVCIIPFPAQETVSLSEWSIFFLTDGFLLVRHKLRGHDHLPGVSPLGHRHFPAVSCHPQPQHLPPPAPLRVPLLGQVSLPHRCRQDRQPGLTSLRLGPYPAP